MRCCTTPAERRRPRAVRPGGATTPRLLAAAGLVLAAAGAAAGLSGGPAAGSAAPVALPAAKSPDAPAAKGLPAPGPTENPLVALGRRLYRTGAGGAAGEPEIIAVIGGEGGTEVGATELPCAGCHGRDGRGRPEGGVAPSDLTWEVLTRPYGVARSGGRHAPAYDEHTLKRAITLGLDAGGAQLQPAMPRYRLTQQQAAALVAYLRVLGHEADPGISADRLRLGVLLPPGTEAAAVRGDLDAFAGAVNGTGGLYGRRLDLRYLASPPLGPAATGSPGAAASAGSWRAAVERFVAGEQVFALVASSFGGASEELAALAADEELPVVGALTAEPRRGPPFNPWVFYLQSGLAEQARALVDAAASGLGGPPPIRPGLLVPVAATGSAQPGGAAAAEDAAAATAALAQFDRDGLKPWAATYHTGAGEMAERAAAANRAGVDALVFLGDAAAARELLSAAADIGWRPRLFLLAVRAGGALAGAAPAGFGGSLYLAAPALPSDVTAKGLDLLRLNPAPRPSPHATAYERAALAAVAVLREALSLCGREVSRDGLIAALESLHAFDTGLTPPQSFDANRRIGALGAYIVAYDPRHPEVAPDGGWVTPR